MKILLKLIIEYDILVVDIKHSLAFYSLVEISTIRIIEYEIILYV